MFSSCFACKPSTPYISFTYSSTPRLNMGYLFLLNKKHEKTRVSMGKSAKIIDHSMQAVGAVTIDKTEVPQPMLSEDNAFKDLTDWENEDFVYVY